MKKLIGPAFGVLLLIGIGSTATAQIQLGGGLAYGTEIENIGIQVGGTYAINDEIRAAADIVYYFTGEDVPGVDFNWLEINANGHYMFVDEEDLDFYALGGINFTRLSYDFPNNEFFDLDDSQTEVGLNVGAGLEYAVNFGNLYAEVKYVLSDADQLVLSGGVRILIGD